MENIEAFERIDELVCRIERMTWLAGCVNESGNEMLEDITDFIEVEDLGKIFPNMKEEIIEECLDENCLETLFFDNHKIGFLVEVYTPKLDNFRYNEQGKPTSWNVHNGSCEVDYIYGETTEDIVEKIEELSKEKFKKYLEIDNNK